MSDGQRPNILVIWGDDIGISNLSCYNDGLMGYRTPNIDRVAAGRSAFITGQSVFRTQAIVGEFLATFKEFPPRQKAASFTVDQVMLAGIGR